MTSVSHDGITEPRSLLFILLSTPRCACRAKAPQYFIFTPFSQDYCADDMRSRESGDAQLHTAAQERRRRPRPGGDAVIWPALFMGIFLMRSRAMGRRFHGHRRECCFAPSFTCRPPPFSRRCALTPAEATRYRRADIQPISAGRGLSSVSFACVHKRHDRHAAARRFSREKLSMALLSPLLKCRRRCWRRGDDGALEKMGAMFFARGHARRKVFG